ncbi:Usg protein [Lactococcus lactis subsp. lactis]|uniref:Usg protein n=1 Tax=Lactococcus lactis subsp. lactis TaxID=1360 RepID=A0A0V8D5E8_LACLL|nr:SIR2 family protein [Lactococcus lactis]KSU08786.1 Usg protein [Lactococcus lactis subsp. lactis]
MGIDIKKMILDFTNSAEYNNRNRYAHIETLVQIIMKDYIAKQQRPVQINYRNKMTNSIIEYDIYASEGFDNFIGETAIELKLVRNRPTIRNVLMNSLIRFENREIELKNIIFLTIGNEVTNNERSYFGGNSKFNIDFWGIDKFVEICETNEELFVDTYNNLDKYMITGTISKGIVREPKAYKEKRNQYLKQLHKEYHSDNLTLFLGAGASHDAKIATWENLISGLFVSLVNKSLKTNGIHLTDTIEKEVIEGVMTQNGYSPLLQTRFLRQGFEEDFERLVRKILYKEAIPTSKLLEEIGQLCIPLRGKSGIKAIINYNFDDLIEKNLKRLRMKVHSIYSEGEKVEKDELGVYHVHGFLPEHGRTYENLSKSLLVFSEEGYHKLLLDPYNWANMIQLDFLTKSSCLFIGLSMTDPNLRRLLDIAAQKSSDDSCNHYALIKRVKLIKSSTGQKELENFEQVNEELQESFFREVGVNIIWFDDFEEIPDILKAIKG